MASGGLAGLPTSWGPFSWIEAGYAVEPSYRRWNEHTPVMTQRIYLEPRGQWLEFADPETLRDALFRAGMEFPCAGNGICGNCRVQVLGEPTAPTSIETECLTSAELEAGWRLACQIQATRDLRIRIGQWEAPILETHHGARYNLRDGYGIAVDLGTTTLVAQLVNLATGEVMGVAKGLNPQAAYGSDVMTRIQFAVSADGLTKLVSSIRGGVGQLIAELADSNPAAGTEVDRIVVAGNTTMAHALCGFDLSPLSRFPFQSEHIGLQELSATDLGWSGAENAHVWVLPLLGGFIGGDIFAGILSTRMHRREDVVMLIDIGTNGEIAIGNRDHILCASTPAGPAFEGGGITRGMHASTGAIDSVKLIGRELQCHVIGGSEGMEAKGICGSGLVDAAAACLDLGVIDTSGRVCAEGDPIRLAGTIDLTQADVRQLQLAKAAIAASARVLIERYGSSREEIEKVYLGGAFGNYIRAEAASRIGLLEFPPERVHPAGNTALHGAKLALGLEGGDRGFAREFDAIREIVEHVSLCESGEFYAGFVEATRFPEMDRAPQS